MAFEDAKEFDLSRIQQDFNIKQNIVENLSISKEELGKIYHNFQASIPKLEVIRTEILSILNERLYGKVHSIRGRVKDPDHLIEKIIRNVNCKPDKYSRISIENYNKIITDLIGIRIIILDKRDWRAVHDSLLQVFRNLPERYVHLPEDIATNYDAYKQEAMRKGHELENSYHAEKPVVYITSEDDRNLYKDDYLKVDPSKTHYRSIHYIIRYKFVYFEIQVRTLFEEGWLEFDHRIKYPYDQNNKKKQEFASILSGLAIAADRLISFYSEADFQCNFADDIDKSVPKPAEKANRTDDQTLEGRMNLLF